MRAFGAPGAFRRFLLMILMIAAMTGTGAPPLAAMQNTGGNLAATPISGDPSPTATPTPTPTSPAASTATVEPTATEPALQTQVVPPLFTLNNSQTGVEVPVGSSINALAVGLPVETQATLLHFAGTGCGGASEQDETGTVTGSGTIQWAVGQDTAGTFSYQVMAGDVTTNCVNLTVTPPAGPTLAMNNTTGVVTVVVGEMSWINLTGAAPEAAGTITLFGSPDCTATGNDSPMPVTVNADGSFIDGEWSFDDPGEYSLQATFPNGQISNCLTIVVNVSAPPLLTVNGSAGPLIVAPDSSLEIAATGLPSTTSVTLGMWMAAGCAGDPGSATSLETGASGNVATTSRMTGSSVAYRVDVELGGQRVSTNCVSVAAGAAQAIVLSIDGYVDYAPMGATKASNFRITGLDSASTPYFLNYFAVPSMDCTGVATSSTDLSLLDPDYGSTAEFTMDTLHAYNVTSSDGEVSNCVYVEHWVGSPIPRLAVDHHANSYVVTVGTTVSVSIENGGAGDFTFYQYADANCMDDETYLMGGNTLDGEATVGDLLIATGMRSYKAQTENGDTNCVTVYIIDDSVIETPLLTIDGSVGPVNVVPMTTYPVESSGWRPGVPVSHLLYLEQDCTGTALPVSSNIMPDSDGVISGGNVYLQNANFPVVSYQLVSNFQTSNCVTVHVYDELPVSPRLTVNNQSGPVQVTTGSDLTMQLTGFPEQVDVVVFQFAGAGCQGDGLAWDALTTDGLGWASNTLAAPGAAGALSLLARERLLESPVTNCVDVLVSDTPAPVLTANNSLGPAVVEFDDPVTLFATGLAPETDVAMLQFAGAECSGEAKQIATGTSLASGSFLASASLDPGASVSFQVADPVSNCVNVSVGEEPQPPADPVLSVNNGAGPLTVNTGDILNLLVTGLPQSNVDVDAAAVNVQLWRFAAAGCAGTGTIVAEGLSSDAGAFTATDTVNTAGTFSYLGSGGNLTSNCVDVTVQDMAEPTPTATTAPSATSLPAEPTATAGNVQPGLPHATATVSPTIPAAAEDNAGGVTTLPSTGADPGGNGTSWIWLLCLPGLLMLGAAVAMQSCRKHKTM